MKKRLTFVFTAIFLLFTAIFLLLTGYFYVNFNQSSNITKKPQEDKIAVVTPDKSQEPLRTVTCSPDFAVLYTNLDQLVEKATIIVEGRITDVSYFDYNTITFTKALVEVTKSYNSNAKEGDVLTFAEPGGITTEAALIRSNDNKFNQPITDVQENTKVQVQFAEEPLLKVNENILFFGGVGELPLLPEKFYVSLGTFQGRFKINGDSIERYVPKDMVSSQYSSLEMSKIEFDQKLSEAVKNKKL